MSILFTTASFAENKNPKKVVVIGAGLAGLTTAYRLHSAGMDVDLYEARGRVGGRVFTVHINGSIAELGAQNITDGGEAVNINRLIDEFGLERVSSRVNLSYCYFDGKDLISSSEILKKKKFDPKILKNQLDSLGSTSHNMKEILDKFIEETDPLYKIIAVRLAAYEGGPVEKLSPIYVDTLFHMLLGGICSVHQGNGEENNYINVGSIKGGNSLLPEKMAAALGARVHLNRPLTRVCRENDGSFKLTFDDGQELNADILVLAIPCSVYNKISFEDEVIPLEKLEAIRNVPYGTNAKILLHLRTIPSKKPCLINDKIVSFFDANQNILTLYYTGNTSLFSPKTIPDAYMQARPLIDQWFEYDRSLFENPTFAADQNFQTYHTAVGYSWPNDPYAKGSYSYIASGQETLLTTVVKEQDEKFKALFKPLQNLYFVGEHTSILFEAPGTMEAACESGERIARAILAHEFSF